MSLVRKIRVELHLLRPAQPHYPKKLARNSLLARSLPIVIHHLLRNVSLVTEWHRAAGSAVRAARAAAMAALVRVVRTRAASAVRGNRSRDDVLPDLRVRLLRLRPR